jgi:hypothetical protein
VDRLIRALTLALLLLYATPAFAVFPTVAGTAGTYAAADTSWACALPASIAAGELILVFINADTLATSVSFPGAWVELFDTDFTSGAFAGAYLIAAGGETSVTVTQTGGTADDAVCLAYRITGWHGTTPPEDETPANQATPTHPDPPLLTPSWGAEDTLWIVVGASGNCENATDIAQFLAAPTSYGDLIQQNGDSDGSPVECSSATQPSIGAATRNLNATSTNPGAFTINDTGASNSANTIAIRPTAAGRRPFAPTLF